MKDMVKFEFPARSCYESFARMAVSAFVARFDPTIEELAEIKTAISEAVTNVVIHGYKKGSLNEKVYITCEHDGENLNIVVEDKGMGIEDISRAMQPLYTTNPDGERSGMGFTIMETFMDNVQVISEKDKGTTVMMKKKLSACTGGECCG